MIWGITESIRPLNQAFEKRVLLYDDEKKQFILELSNRNSNEKLRLSGQDAWKAFLALQLEELNESLRWSNVKGYKFIPAYGPELK